jgi:hypothetical protein
MPVASSCRFPACRWKDHHRDDDHRFPAPMTAARRQCLVHLRAPCVQGRPAESGGGGVASKTNQPDAGRRLGSRGDARIMIRRSTPSEVAGDAVARRSAPPATAPVGLVPRTPSRAPRRPRRPTWEIGADGRQISCGDRFCASRNQRVSSATGRHGRGDALFARLRAAVWSRARGEVRRWKQAEQNAFPRVRPLACTV